MTWLEYIFFMKVCQFSGLANQAKYGVVALKVNRESVAMPGAKCALLEMVRHWY
jgi:hypothetical protein